MTAATSSARKIDPIAKLKIVALEVPPDRDKLSVEAQFNPKEVQIDKSIPWTKQQHRGAADLEYTGCEPKSMSLELLFDAFERPDCDDQRGIRGTLADLERMTEHLGTSKAADKRPPKVKVLWGADAAALNLPEFIAVIESLVIKYSMFASDGKILRATATVKLKQADNLKIGKKK